MENDKEIKRKGLLDKDGNEMQTISELTSVASEHVEALVSLNESLSDILIKVAAITDTSGDGVNVDKQQKYPSSLMDQIKINNSNIEEQIVAAKETVFYLERVIS